MPQWVAGPAEYGGPQPDSHWPIVFGSGLTTVSTGGNGG